MYLSCLIFSIPITLSSFMCGSLLASPWDPAASDYAGQKGKTLYVSKLGDNSDGSSWPKAFRTKTKRCWPIPRFSVCAFDRATTQVA